MGCGEESKAFPFQESAEPIDYDGVGIYEDADETEQVLDNQAAFDYPQRVGGQVVAMEPIA